MELAGAAYDDHSDSEARDALRGEQCTKIKISAGSGMAIGADARKQSQNGAHCLLATADREAVTIRT